MATKSIIPVLVGMMLLTGCCNTLLTKYQDMQCVRNCDGPGKKRTFEQPVIQTVQMFIGETGCWLVIFGVYLSGLIRKHTREAPVLYQPVQQDEGEDDDIQATAQEQADPVMKSLVPNADDRTPLKGWKVVLLGLPACCDITATTLMNIGLLFTAASIYQMTRGTIVLFVGTFSVVFLKRKLYLYHWLSLIIVVLGVGLVGLAGSLFSGDKNPASQPSNTIPQELAVRILDEVDDTAVLRTVIGILMIAFAQIFTATQFVLEEYILERYALEPIKVVGWEGIFGLVVTLFAQLLLHFSIGVSDRGRGGYFDAAEGYQQVFENKTILLTSFAIMISIGGFNFFGLSVTRTISATSRSIIDTCRTLFIWIVSLGLGWESFKWLQVVGFGLLVYGTVTFNDLIRPPIRALRPKKEDTPPAYEGLPEVPEGDIGRH